MLSCCMCGATSGPFKADPRNGLLYCMDYLLCGYRQNRAYQAAQARGR